jgi:YVTN family beta-propeller protein
VIDPSNNMLLGLIRLGDSRENVFSALYKGALNVHGLGFSPDHRTLAVISTGSNSVTLVETATNKIKGTIYIGRSPHEGFFTPDGNELWVTVRGEDYISVIDPVAMKEKRRIQTANGPGMVVFSPDGKRAYVCHSFTAELHVIDVKTSRTIKRVPVISPFSPNLAVTSNGNEVWLTHKDVGKITVFNTQTLEVERVIETGFVTNHVQFARTAEGRFAYVTVGGEDVVKVYKRGVRPEFVTTIRVGALPHGMWVSDDGTRIYVGLENEDSVTVIDTTRQEVVATIKTGQMPQALVFVSNAAPAGSGTNLMPLERVFDNVELRFEKPKDQAATGHGKDKVQKGFGVIRPLGLQDSLEVTFFGLEPETEYQLVLSESSRKETAVIAVLRSNVQGRGVAQVLSPIRQIVFAKNSIQPGRNGTRLLTLEETKKGRPHKIVLESAINR